ncbi:MAG: hypothetical protein EXR72_22690 [Myxococcales bacterium]|nr:hypothetical protein [Myxococcales bacterium]
MRTLLFAAAALLLAGCPASTTQDQGRMPPPLDTAYPDGPEGLKKIWTDILTAGRRDERERVHTLMASFVMSDEDLTVLLGEEKGRYLLPRYLPMIATLVNIGSMELVAQIDEKKFDEIEVVAIDEQGSDIDRATLAALKVKTPVYSVRVLRKEKRDGFRLRYDFFVYRNGHWITGNQLAKKYLVAERPDAGAAKDGGAPRLDGKLKLGP